MSERDIDFAFVYSVVAKCNDIDAFRVEEEIGRGSFGTVHLAYLQPRSIDSDVEHNIRLRLLQWKFAIKITPKRRTNARKQRQRLKNELEMHRSLSHPNIVHVISAFEDLHFVYFVQEYCDGGDLAMFLRRRTFLSTRDVSHDSLSDDDDIMFVNTTDTSQYSDRVAASLPPWISLKFVNGVIKDVASALYYLHVQGISHNDIKPQNILLNHSKRKQNGFLGREASYEEDFPTALISDFGLASRITTTPFTESMSSSDQILTIRGTPNYVAPEILAGEAPSAASDVWSLGCLLVAMLTGKPPFQKESVSTPSLAETLLAVRLGKYDLPSDLSESVATLVRRILVLDPTERLTVDAILKWPLLTEEHSLLLAPSDCSSMRRPPPLTEPEPLLYSTNTIHFTLFPDGCLAMTDENFSFLYLLSTIIEDTSFWVWHLPDAVGMHRRQFWTPVLMTPAVLRVKGVEDSLNIITAPCLATPQQCHFHRNVHIDIVDILQWYRYAQRVWKTWSDRIMPLCSPNQSPMYDELFRLSSSTSSQRSSRFSSQASSLASSVSSGDRGHNVGDHTLCCSLRDIGWVYRLRNGSTLLVWDCHCLCHAACTKPDRCSIENIKQVEVNANADTARIMMRRQMHDSECSDRCTCDPFVCECACHCGHIWKIVVVSLQSFNSSKFLSNGSELQSILKTALITVNDAITVLSSVNACNCLRTT